MKHLKSAPCGAPDKHADDASSIAAKRDAAELKAEVSAAGEIVLKASPEGLQAATGTSNSDLAKHMLDQASVGIRASSNAARAQALNATLAALRGIQPKDPVEGMLAVQITASHNLAMAFLKAASGGGTDIDRNLNRALKQMGIFQRAVDTLKRYRGKDPQRIVVERINVGNGGNAAIMIGNPELGDQTSASPNNEQPPANRNLPSRIPAGIKAVA